jgi:hypothetical protein
MNIKKIEKIIKPALNLKVSKSELFSVVGKLREEQINFYNMPIALRTKISFILSAYTRLGGK